MTENEPSNPNCPGQKIAVEGVKCTLGDWSGCTKTRIDQKLKHHPIGCGVLSCPYSMSGDEGFY